MILKQDWINKFKSWFPKWLFDSTNKSDAIFGSMAKNLESVSANVSQLIDSTYIDKAVGSYLDILGADRNVERGIGESDFSYSKRIKTSGSKSNVDKNSLISLINSVLVRGVCRIVEDFDSENYLSNTIYLNRGDVLIDKKINSFTIIVDKQILDQDTFLNRDRFISFNYIGSNDSDIEIFNSILKIVNKNKAFGTMFRIVERDN